jgi:hypothetical protein
MNRRFAMLGGVDALVHLNLFTLDASTGSWPTRWETTSHQRN